MRSLARAERRGELHRPRIPPCVRRVYARRLLASRRALCASSRSMRNPRPPHKPHAPDFSRPVVMWWLGKGAAVPKAVARGVDTGVFRAQMRSAGEDEGYLLERGGNVLATTQYFHPPRGIERLVLVRKLIRAMQMSKQDYWSALPERHDRRVTFRLDALIAVDFDPPDVPEHDSDDEED